MSLKRLEGINKSPVLNHLSSSYQGLATIRSFNSQKILIEEFDNHQDVHSSVWSMFIRTSVTYDFWLDNLCSIYACIVTMSLLIFVRNDEIVESSIGLVTTQIVGLIGFLAFTMQQITELGNQMTSVERVYEYTNLESESPLNSLTDKKPEEKWPENGKIQFKNVYMSYDPSEAPVLKNLNFSIDGNEKIGIVGRTGAGKSSLISALFRLAYLEGEIKIDEIETKQIGLHDLRTKISIIPQEPFLIAGVLRKNLDPFDLYEDHVLRSALDDVELKEMDLQTYINERGNNLSVGQRQLVCLARAIIKNNKILILDEATANVDSKTDELIQKTIRKKFTDCTVVTIAHRLNTVMDSDKILVMDAGRVVEFDRPQVLLQNSHGAFTNMINQTGETMANSLRNLARDKHMDFN
ncbi:probable multidrug resistance-associated protein lethal(2)03659 [Aphidius gifuensis]|nr:probable multidrug resistance-associated protein lethal(2)03659 [Aphidius gifuensis]